MTSIAKTILGHTCSLCLPNQDIKIEFAFQRGKKGVPRHKKPKLDVVPVGEDSTSFNRYNKLLQLEYKKVCVLIHMYMHSF